MHSCIAVKLYLEICVSILFSAHCFEKQHLVCLDGSLFEVNMALNNTDLCIITIFIRVCTTLIKYYLIKLVFIL